MIKDTRAVLPPQVEATLESVLTRFVKLKKTQRGAWTTQDLLDILQDMRLRMPPDLRVIPPQIQFRWDGETAGLILTWDAPAGPGAGRDMFPAYRVDWTYTDDGRVSRMVQTKGDGDSLECCVTYTLGCPCMPLPGFWTLV